MPTDLPESRRHGTQSIHRLQRAGLHTRPSPPVAPRCRRPAPARDTQCPANAARGGPASSTHRTMPPPPAKSPRQSRADRQATRVFWPHQTVLHSQDAALRHKSLVEPPRARAPQLFSIELTFTARLVHCDPTTDFNMVAFARHKRDFLGAHPEHHAAQLRCVMFRMRAQKVAFMPREGDHIEVCGRVTMYEPRGECQLNAEQLRRTGAGRLYEAFMALKQRLENEGLFDVAKKRALPVYPRAIGVVTSLAAAALCDVLTTLARRAPHLPVIVYPTPVQGAGSAAQ